MTDAHLRTQLISNLSYHFNTHVDIITTTSEIVAVDVEHQRNTLARFAWASPNNDYWLKAVQRSEAMAKETLNARTKVDEGRVRELTEIDMEAVLKMHASASIASKSSSFGGGGPNDDNRTFQQLCAQISVTRLSADFNKFVAKLVINGTWTKGLHDELEVFQKRLKETEKLFRM